MAFALVFLNIIANFYLIGLHLEPSIQSSQTSRLCGLPQFTFSQLLQQINFSTCSIVNQWPCIFCWSVEGAMSIKEFLISAGSAIVPTGIQQAPAMSPSLEA